MRQLTYRSLDINSHPIDTVQEEHGFGPFESAFSPWEFADPAASVDRTWNAGSSDHGFGAPANLLTLFSDPSTDRVNQVLGAMAADNHRAASSGWVHDVFNGVGQGVIPRGSTNG